MTPRTFTLAALAAASAAVALAQTPAGEPAPAPAEAPRETRASANPYAAYEAGEYDRALEGFVARRVAKPDDPQLQLNVGSAHYQLRDYPSAEQEYRRASEAKKTQLRAEALYNLGNAAYRQGRLEESVGLYQDALALDPDDQDAKYNLEFVQREIERRRQQAQERQQQPQQKDEQQQQQQQQREQQQEGQEGEDGDRDGLPDRQEREAENPTDPNDPDTDGDGRRDGEEDRNRNGKVDPGETDPNQPDSPPSGEGGAEDQQQGEGQQQPAPSGQAGERSMSPEEAARFLQGLDEKRPADPKRGRVARRAPGGKPW